MLDCYYYYHHHHHRIAHFSVFLGNIHLSWDAEINRIRLGDLIYSLKSSLQSNTCQELKIFAFVIGCKLSRVRLCDRDFGIIPVDDITIGITCAAFCFHMAHISFASSWYLFCLSVIILARLCVFGTVMSIKKVFFVYLFMKVIIIIIITLMSLSLCVCVCVCVSDSVSVTCLSIRLTESCDTNNNIKFFMHLRMRVFITHILCVFCVHGYG